MQDLAQIYQERAASFERTSAALRHRYNRLALVRLVIFLAAILGVVYLWSLHWAAGVGFLLLFILSFYRFMRWHQRIEEEADHQARLARINAFEAAAQNELFPGGPWSDGAGFVDADHPYTYDLDLFGQYSFFHYCNRAGTTLGRERLAGYLRHGGAPAEIGRRQEAVAELRDRLDWRQHLQAYGLETRDDPQYIELLRQWLQDGPFVLDNRWLRAALYLTPVWMIAGIVLWIFYLPWPLAILFFLPPAWILRRTADRVNRTHQRTTQAERALAHYARLIDHLEGQPFRSALLADLQKALTENGKAASSAIRRLSYIISQLNVRYNFFAVFLNLFGLWDLQWVYRLERWKSIHHAALPAWFDALAAVEALGSLATALFNNPDWTFPAVTDRRELRAEALGHPLIHRSRRVANDLAMPTRGHIKLITGSNMAGKSTFLRTAGLNIVLAMAGSAVCAHRLELPPLQVYTSMRTQDALHESTSSFYAELKRLKFIIEAVEHDLPDEPQIFFLLDEILKGTNSRDRHTGSKALIRQLIHSGGAGLIATHDLELGALESRYAGAIENLRIEVEIRDGELHFDYKLKKGVSESFNATLLMRNMGIRIAE